VESDEHHPARHPSDDLQTGRRDHREAASIDRRTSGRKLRHDYRRRRQGLRMMRATSAAWIAACVLALPRVAAAQTTIFTTADFHQDRDRWTDPAYYRNNTVNQLHGMAL